MPRKLTALLATLALLTPVVALGCGGGDDNGGGSSVKNGLGTTDNLSVDQDRADIEEFCSISPVGKGPLYDRALFSVVDATDDMILVYKDNRNSVYHDPIKKRNTKMNLLLEQEAKKLDGCGKDGKHEAAKLRQALQAG